MRLKKIHLKEIDVDELDSLYVNFLSGVTNLHPEELKLIIKDHFENDLNGEIDKEAFTKIYLSLIQAVPDIDGEKLSSTIFAAFDKNSDEKLNLREFLVSKNGLKCLYLLL